MNYHRGLFCSFLSASLLLTYTGFEPSAAQAWVGPGANHPERQWKVFETEHFQVHYYQGFEEFARLAVSIGEAGFDSLAQDLGVTLQAKIPLIITEDQFWNGYAEPLRTRIVLDPRFSLEPTIGLSRFLLHELTHILNFLAVENQTPLSRLNKSAGLPSWFAEGLAQYEAEYWAPEMDRLMRMHSLNDTLLTPAARNAFIMLGDRGGDGYNEGYALVKYLFETYGHHLVAELLGHYRSQNISFDQALALTFGKPLLQLEAEWRDQFSQRYAAQIRHRHPSIQSAQNLVPYTKGKTWYQPKPSPDGKWLAYQTSAGYPTIRGYIYQILPLQLASLQSLAAYGKQVEARQASKQETKGSVPAIPSLPSESEPDSPVPGPEPISNLRLPHGDGPEIELEDTENQLVERALDFAWRPDSQALAYTTLKANRHGNSTFKVQIQPLQVKADKLEAQGEAIDLAPELTTHSPVWTPDGQFILLVSEEQGRDHLDLFDVTSRSRVRRLYSAPDLRQFRGLSLSPDGKAAVLEVYLPDQSTHLLKLELATGRLEQLTSPGPRQMDRQPVWSPDGQSIYFISTRTGFADLYRLELATRQLERLSQVYSGLETPALSADSETLYFARHHAFGTSLEAVEPKGLKPFDTYREQALVQPFAQDTVLSTLPQLEIKPQDYMPWIAPEVVIPVVGRDEVGDQLGFLAQFSDLLQQQSLNLLLLYGIASSRIGFSTAYVNHMFDTSFGVAVGDMPALSFTTDGSQFFIQRDQSISLFASRPLFNEGSGDTAATRIERFATLDFTVSRQTNLTSALDGVITSRELREGFNNTLALSFNDNRSRNRKKGFRYSVNLSGGSWLWGSEYSFLAATADWRQYIPLWAEHTLAYYLTATAMTGETRPALLGGPPLNNLLVLNFQNITPLRGFRLAELQGPMMFGANVEYRIPLVSGLFLNLGDHYLKNLEMAAFVDIGDAWYPEQRSVFPHIGTGLELRSDVILSRRNAFQLYFGAGKALLGSGENYLSERPVEIYGGFINVF